MSQSRTEFCKNCKFWFRENESYSQYGYCRRHAPKRNNEHIQTYLEDWCGEHQPKDNSYALIFADWLEEQGFKEAAEALRKFDKT